MSSEQIPLRRYTDFRDNVLEEKIETMKHTNEKEHQGLNDKINEMESTNKKEHKELNNKIDNLHKEISSVKQDIGQKLDETKQDIQTIVVDAIVERRNKQVLKGVKWFFGVVVGAVILFFREKLLGLFHHLF